MTDNNRRPPNKYGIAVSDTPTKTISKHERNQFLLMKVVFQRPTEKRAYLRNKNVEERGIYDLLRARTHKALLCINIDLQDSA